MGYPASQPCSELVWRTVCRILSSIRREGACQIATGEGRFKYSVYGIAPYAGASSRQRATQSDESAGGPLRRWTEIPPLENRGQADFFVCRINSMIFPRSGEGIHLSFFRKLIGM